MAALHVRNVPEPLYEKLRVRASREGRSINGEAICILEEALAKPSPSEFRNVLSRLRRGRPVEFFQRFTERGRRVVVHAQDEARALRHRQIGTEHLLLGLLVDPEGLAHEILAAGGVELDEVRARVVEALGEGTEAREGQVPFTPAAKEALEVALREALALRHDFIGTEHVLLALLRQSEGLAARILLDRGVGYEPTRDSVLAALGETALPSVSDVRFEYRVVELADPLADAVAKLAGEDGWEFVSVTGDSPVRQGVLKRLR